LRKGEAGPEELCIRTHLTADAARLRQAGRMIEEIREMAGRLDPALIPLVTLLEFEAGYRPCEQPYAHAAEALSFGHNWPHIILNHGATACLEKAIPALDDHGFVLINDYGLVRAQDAGSLSGTQRFGSSAALGLNFPLLEHHFSAAGTAVLTPEGDEQASLHARLLTRAAIPQTRLAFHQVFDWAAQRVETDPQDRARKNTETGNLDAAKQAYEAALAARPRDWALLGEIAEFLIRQVADYQSGLVIAQAALAVNPWYSVWLWNVYGDALYALDRFQEAHEAYLKAAQLEPRDVRTNLNLGYSYSHLGNHQAALEAIARGMANDRTGIFRERLVEKQLQILTAVQTRSASEQEWLARRASRLASAG
jgi:tetratricopeptide (TPR) repeat protein